MQREEKKKQNVDTGKTLLRYLTFPKRSPPAPCNIALPLAGMCGGGSSGSSGDVPVALLSDFFLMFFLWALGEELEELLELVTVSPELHEREEGVLITAANDYNILEC